MKKENGGLLSKENIKTLNTSSKYIINNNDDKLLEIQLSNTKPLNSQRRSIIQQNYIKTENARKTVKFKDKFYEIIDIESFKLYNQKMSYEESYQQEIPILKSNCCKEYGCSLY
jgi:hypothetical protein